MHIPLFRVFLAVLGLLVIHPSIAAIHKLEVLVGADLRWKGSINGMSYVGPAALPDVSLALDSWQQVMRITQEVPSGEVLLAFEVLGNSRRAGGFIASI
jgi:hypothetical protein